MKTINGYIDTTCSQLSGECSDATYMGGVAEINAAIIATKVQPACDAPGAKVTYVIDISAMLPVGA